jgi:predicted translin family RNA/ssDNA-binding protein
MINKKFIDQLKKAYVAHEGERRQIISLANVVLHDSKRVIFSLHRGDVQKAEESLAEIEKVLVNLDKKFGHCRLAEEGAYKAGVEEYIEAKLFYFVSTGRKVEKIKGVNLDADSYLGGLSDLTGEMVRQAINEAASGNYAKAEAIKAGLSDIMAELVEFDMTGYLRTKYDQAKNNLRKIEQVAYEVKLRGK